MTATTMAKTLTKAMAIPTAITITIGDFNDYNNSNYNDNNIENDKSNESDNNKN